MTNTDHIETDDSEAVEQLIKEVIVVFAENPPPSSKEEFRSPVLGIHHEYTRKNSIGRRGVFRRLESNDK